MIISQLLRDVSWSFPQGKLHELFFRDGITFATWGLVLATLLLVLYSWRSGIKQTERWDAEDKQRQDDRTELRSRWEREDVLRREESKPKYAFGVAFDEQGLVFWIANIGITSFLVKTVFLNRRLEVQTQFSSAPGKWNEIVPVGEKRIFQFERSLFHNSLPEGIEGLTVQFDCKVGCSIVGVDGVSVVSVQREFSLFVNKDGHFYMSEPAEY